MPNKIGRGLVLTSPSDRLIFSSLGVPLLFPSGFDEDAGQPTIKQGAASAYAKEVCFMEVLYKRCCGIDIHKNMMVACIFTSVRKKKSVSFQQ